MGAGASAQPYESVDDAKKAGKTQSEIDAWLEANQYKASATAKDRPVVELVFNDAIKEIQFDEVCMIHS